MTTSFDPKPTLPLRSKPFSEPQTFVGPLSTGLASDLTEAILDSKGIQETLRDLLTGKISARELAYQIQIIAEIELEKLEEMRSVSDIESDGDRHSGSGAV